MIHLHDRFLLKIGVKTPESPMREDVEREEKLVGVKTRVKSPESRMRDLVEEEEEEEEEFFFDSSSQDDEASESVLQPVSAANALAVVSVTTTPPPTTCLFHKKVNPKISTKHLVLTLSLHGKQEKKIMFVWNYYA